MKYEGVVSAFVALLRASVDRPIGDGDVPDTMLGRVAADTDFPYAVVMPVPGSYLTGGPLVRKDSDVGITVRITAVGRTRAQAQWMGDTVREVVMKRNADGSWVYPLPEVYGRDIEDVGGIEAEGETPRRVYNFACEYVLYAGSVT